MTETIKFSTQALVIDDSKLDAAILEETLKEIGCNVDVSDDLGFPEKMENAYDIIFIDINMPSMDGFLLAKTIRQSNLAIKGVPIIVVSGNKCSPEQVETSIKNGLDGYLEKPVNHKMLIDILREFYPEKEVSVHNFVQGDEGKSKGFFRKRNQN